MKLADEISSHIHKVAISSGYDFGLPNCFIGWYEADYIKLTKSDMLTEYEIKISRSDFKNDFKKLDKHSNIESGNRCNRFYFVCPKDLIKLDEIPEYSGLIYYDNQRFLIVKSAPLITKKKLSSISNFIGKLILREQGYRAQCKKLQRDKKKLQDELHKLKHGNQTKR